MIIILRVIITFGCKIDFLQNLKCIKITDITKDERLSISSRHTSYHQANERNDLTKMAPLLKSY